MDWYCWVVFGDLIVVVVDDDDVDGVVWSGRRVGCF